MKHILQMLLRRMRLPLIALILAYAVSVLGLVLIPGVDDQGNPWRMNFFHAFYFVSFMGSTIGFGEIPYPFTDAQRLWTIVAMYTTVFVWLFSIGTLLAIIQDPAFRRLLSYSLFTRHIRMMNEPFYLVCGYGDTGSLLVGELSSRGIRTVVIDIDTERIDILKTEDLRGYVPGLCADAAESDSLVAAGLTHPRCAGVIALTDVDHTNLTIAITSKLLNPSLQVICRSESHDSEANMASFGTDYIINPFDEFAGRFAMMFRSPGMHLIYEWLTSMRDSPHKDFQSPPRGRWVVCGFGRFGKSIQEHLSYEAIQMTLIEADVEKTNAPNGTIEGRGTEAITLREAGIEDAAGIIAGTGDDANNLSIVITARDLNPDLFTVARQNNRSYNDIFQAAKINHIMQPGTIISQKVLTVILTPMLTDFLRLARHENDEWANILISRMVGVLQEYPLEVWTLKVSTKASPAISSLLAEGEEITISNLCTDPRNREECLACIPLLLRRGNTEELLPTETQILHVGDSFLFCGTREAERHMKWTAWDHNALTYICKGIDRPSGYVWSRLSRQRG